MKFFLGVKELRDNPSVKPAACQLLPSRPLCHFVTFPHSMGNHPFQGSLIYKVLKITIYYRCHSRPVPANYFLLLRLLLLVFGAFFLLFPDGIPEVPQLSAQSEVFAVGVCHQTALLEI